MSNLIGFLFCTLSALAILAILIVMGFRDGDAFGDALVRVRLLRASLGEGWRLYAELEIDNQNDSPVMVAARLRQASALTLFFGSSGARRTALAHRDRLADFELLGAVDGRDVKRFLVPADHAAAARALRVTAIVDQVGRRTRVVTTTLLVSHALDGVLPGGRSVVPGR
jgi:hypothetical protein